MNAVFWLLVIATIGACGWLLRVTLIRWQERQRVEEARAAEFLAQMSGATARKEPPNSAPASPPMAPPAKPAASPVTPASSTSPTNEVATQKMLFEAAHKAGEAGEPALAIQLYARLLVRYPTTTFAEPARAAAAALKKKLVKA
jgi:TolA-binding protein